MSFLEDYEPVEVRLEKFWSENKNGRVITDLVSYGDGEYVVRAEVWRDALEERPTASGYAQELVTAKGVNSTSALENCETSAIGRALANLGYAAKGKRPSREEMAKAQRGGHPGTEPITEMPRVTSEPATGGKRPAKKAQPRTMPDIRAPLFEDIKSARVARGWSAEDVQTDFAVWADARNGKPKPLMEATADELQEYHLTLISTETPV